MIGFWLLAAVLIALAVAAVALPLWRRRGAGTAGDTLAVYRERHAELESEHARGNLDADELAEAVAELEAELVADHTVTDDGPHRSAPSRPYAAIAAVVAVPVIAIVAYATTGRPDLAGAANDGGLSQVRLERFRDMQPQRRIEALQPVVERSPEATRAWILLAQAYRATGRYGDAVDAFARARALGAEDPWLLARQAEALLLANGRRFTGTVERLIQRALSMDRSNPLALMLAGHAALARGDSDRALSYWQRLAEAMPAGSDDRAMVERLIARAEGTAAPSSASAGDPAAGGGASDAPGSGPRLAVRVSLAAGLGDRAPASAPVFVFARRPGAGAGPPLAVARTTAGALPVEITLSDAQAMTSAAELSDAERVVVTARVSLDGGVEASSGDLQGRSDSVAVDGDGAVDVTIDERIP